MRRRASLILLLILSSFVVFVSGCSSTPEAVPEEAPAAETTTGAAGESAEAGAADQEAAAQAAELAAQMARLMEELSAARGTAEAAGAATLFPDAFAKTSSDYEALLQARQENPEADYRGQIEGLRDSYLAMAKLAEAQQLRERIVSLGLQDYDASALQRGDQAMTQAQSLQAANAAGSQLLEQASVAYDSYFSILSANYVSLCETQRASALAAKEKADSIKSAMAAKDSYDVASAALSGAESAYGIKDYAAAYDGYVEAAGLFSSVYDEVFVKRATAEEAIRRARQKVNAAAEKAAEADEIAPLEAEEPAAGQDDSESSESGMEVAQ